MIVLASACGCNAENWPPPMMGKPFRSSRADLARSHCRLPIGAWARPDVPFAHPDAHLAVAAGAVFASAVGASILPLALVLALVAAVGQFARVPWRWVFVATVGPTPMVLLYGMSVGHFAAVDMAVAAMRGAVSATGVLVAVAAVPGPTLLATPVRLLPPWAGIALLVTHRSTVLLAARVAGVRRAVRLRGGLPAWVSIGSDRPRGNGLWRRAEALGAIGGSILLGAIDLGARHGDALRLRGLPPRRAHGADGPATTPTHATWATRVLLVVALLEIAVAAAGRTIRW